jgi:hypothetical protein
MITDSFIKTPFKNIHHRGTEDTEKRYWGIGMMEDWNVGKTNYLSTIPLFHYSIFLAFVISVSLW